MPIIDLRRRFNLSPPEKCFRPCYVILLIESEEAVIEFGIGVDRVVEVVKLHPSDIDAAPAMHNFSDQLIFSQVAKTDGGFNLVLDTPSLLQQLKRDIGTSVSAPVTVHSVT